MKKLLLIALMTCSFGAYADELTPEQVKAKEDACRKDLDCFAQPYFGYAGIYCKEPIEKMAKYDFRWKDKFLSPKFIKAKWLDEKKGTLSFFGDKLQFQNGFGAYQNMYYKCEFDPSEKKVLAVYVQPQQQ